MPRLSRVKYRDNMPHQVNFTTISKFAKLSFERSQFAMLISFSNWLVPMIRLVPQLGIARLPK